MEVGYQQCEMNQGVCFQSRHLSIHVVFTGKKPGTKLNFPQWRNGWIILRNAYSLENYASTKINLFQVSSSIIEVACIILTFLQLTIINFGKNIKITTWKYKTGAERRQKFEGICPLKEGSCIHWVTYRFLRLLQGEESPAWVAQDD